MREGSLSATEPPAAATCLPPLVQTSRGPKAFGVSQAYIYRAAAAGQIKLKKIGRSSYIVTESMLEHIASLPDFKSGQAA